MYPSNQFSPTLQRRRHLNESFRDETVTFKSKFRGHPSGIEPVGFLWGGSGSDELLGRFEMTVILNNSRSLEFRKIVDNIIYFIN